MDNEGKWLAFSEDGKTVVAEDTSPDKVYEEAKDRGVDRPVLAYRPPGDCVAFY